MKWVAKHAVTLTLFGMAALVMSTSSDALAQAGGKARKAESAELTVYEIRASNDKGDSDAELETGALAKKLKKGPFRSWSRFQVMGKHQLQAQQLKARELALKPGGQLSVLYRARMRNDGKKDRLRMSVTMDKPDGKRHLDTTVEVDAGDYFLVGGRSLDDGATYILAISLK
ncbi:MAG TPA: hypothetical protein VML75_26080 [Kofleriaceae bacterium]|nr:hypothetical protein [Kofleriaceae bacterium]